MDNKELSTCHSCIHATKYEELVLGCKLLDRNFTQANPQPQPGKCLGYEPKGGEQCQPKK